MANKLRNEDRHLMRTIAAGTIGTTAMTAYSYVLSETKGENFKEPLLLSSLIFRLIPFVEKSKVKKAGWLIHYGVGIFFAIFYNSLLKRFGISANVKNGSIIGGFTGLFAVVLWHLTLSLHPAPPPVHHRRFYGQLIVAHVIFGTITIFLLDRKIKHPTPKIIQPVNCK